MKRYIKPIFSCLLALIIVTGMCLPTEASVWAKTSKEEDVPVFHEGVSSLSLKNQKIRNARSWEKDFANISEKDEILQGIAVRRKKEKDASRKFGACQEKLFDFGFWNGMSWSIDSNYHLKLQGECTEDVKWYSYHEETKSYQYAAPWAKYIDQIVSAKVSVTGLKAMSWMFQDYSRLKTVDFTGTDTSQVEYMQYMFYGCKSLKSLDLSGFQTRKVKWMHCMFYGCSSLTELDLSGFYTKRVTDMKRMFCECRALTRLDVSGFFLKKGTDIRDMFKECRSLEHLMVTNDWTVSGDTMDALLHDCRTDKFERIQKA